MKYIALTLAVLFGALTVAQAEKATEATEATEADVKKEELAAADEKAPNSKKIADEKAE